MHIYINCMVKFANIFLFKGTRLRANHFRVDDFVDVSAKT